MKPCQATAIHINVNSVRNKVQEIQELVSRTPIVSLQDHRVRSNSDLQHLFSGYTINGFPHDSEGPGVALLIASSLQQRILFTHCADRHRCVAMEVTLPEMGNLTFVVATYYAPPHPPNARLDPDLLERCLSAGPRVLLLGDLNARHVSLGCTSTNHNGVTLRDFLQDSDYILLNEPTQPTFFHTGYDSCDCLDYAIATPGLAALHMGCTVGDDVGSDHLPLLLTRPTASRRVPGPPPLPRWTMPSKDEEEATWASFQRELTRALTEDEKLWPPEPPETAQELDEAARRIETIMQGAADSTLKRVTNTGPRYTHMGPPLPLDVRWLISERRRLRRREAKGAPGLRTRINALREEIRRATEEAKTHHLARMAEAIAGGPKHPDFWREVRTKMRPSDSLPNPPLRRANTPGGNAGARGDEERAELFEEHMRSISSSIQATSNQHSAFHDEVEERCRISPVFRPLPTTRIPHDAEHLSSPSLPWTTVDEESDPFLRLPPSLDPRNPEWVTVPEGQPEDDPVIGPVNPYQLLSMARKLRKRKAPGHDGVRNEMLRNAPFPFFSSLAAVFEASLKLGHLPLCWKTGHVRMIPKAGKNLTLCGHYRPICLASNIGKLLERLVARRLGEFVERNNLLPVEQSAFRFGRNTTEQVLVLQQQATKAMNLQLTTAVLAMDMARAFDGVWHDGLREVCRRVLPHRTTRWISSFLEGRWVRILEGQHLSRGFTPKAGVPQGSPLSPLLFTLYTASAPLPKGGCKGATAFADDHALWATAADPQQAWTDLQPHVDNFTTWCQRWKLELNPAKTQLLFISRRLTWRDEDYPAASILGQPLHRANELKLLGVTLDQRLTFSAHARLTKEALQPRVLQLRRLMSDRRIGPHVGRLLYRTFIRPAITYGAPALLTASNTVWLSLEQLERAAIRAFLRVPISTPNTQLRAWSRLPAIRRVYEDASADFLRWCRRRNNKRVLNSIPDPGGIPHRAYKLPPLNAALLHISDSERSDFPP